MSRLEPIAIVGQGCVLPGALTPDALFDQVLNKRCSYALPPPGFFGRTPAEDRASGYVTGFVEGFDTVFDPERYRNAGVSAATLDPVCSWPLHAAMQAWQDAGAPKLRSGRCGVIVANLSYPNRALAAYAAEVWAGRPPPSPPPEVFYSPAPAHIIAQALGARGPVFALDAACASSLYALDIACQKLAARQIDCAVVAGVNAADNLILHIGFDALKALSPTGRSRPFASDADGLVPSEGAAAIIVKRLGDVEPGEHVHGVIRGIGLSNDGRRKGLLAPDDTGQVEAMQRAYKSAGLSPAEIDYLECHATGTPTGDGVEIRASTQMFGQNAGLPVGSLKANTGHLITVAGLASLLKLTGAMRHETLPPTPVSGDINTAFADSSLTPLITAEAWTASTAPRRAAISNFGFGGNNAHLVLEQHQAVPKGRKRKAPRSKDDIVICGVGLLAGQDVGREAILRRLINAPVKVTENCSQIGTDALAARAPPRDLAQAEPQQLAVLETVNEALAGVVLPELDRCGIFVGMGGAADSARWLLRERLANQHSFDPGSAAHKAAMDRVAPPLEAAAVLGAMANMTANRVTFARDFRGQGFSVSAEHASGLAALDIACDGLRSGRLDMAVVSAADFATEPVRTEALKEMAIADDPGDQAAALVLKRRKDAEAAGDRILGVVGSVEWQDGQDASSASARSTPYGTAPAASVIFDMALAAMLSAHGLRSDAGVAVPDLSGKPATPQLLTAPCSKVSVGGRAEFIPAKPMPIGDPIRPPPQLFWAAGRSGAELAERLSRQDIGGEGDHRIAILAKDEDELASRLGAAAEELLAGRHPAGNNIYYGEGPPNGEMAFMFTGSAAVYPRMSRRLFMAFPDVASGLSKLDKANDIAPLLSRASLTEFEQLCAGTLVSQAHAILLKDILGVKPDAAIGLSLGESNALFAFGFWDDPGALLDEISDAAMYERHIGGAFETAAQAWGPNVPSDWTNWRVQAPIEDVRAAIGERGVVEITIIYSDTDCMIGGPAADCAAVCKRVGKGAGVRMNQHLVVHARAMQPFADTWRALHTRTVHKGDPVRLYANAIHAAYTPDSETVAEMLTRQAVATVDFPKTVKQAWADGVRCFVELGPRDTLTRSVGSILKDKRHLAVATDRVGKSDLEQVAILAATLFADGREVNIGLVGDRLKQASKWLSPRKNGSDVGRAVPYTAPVLPIAEGSGAGPVFSQAPALPPVVYPKSEPCIRTERSVVFPPPPGRPPPPRKVNSGAQALMPRRPIGPASDRPLIEASTRGLMSQLLGPEFASQDSYRRQVRLPAPPLLLVDRITGIDAEPGIDGCGVIWTETDLKEGDWFLHNGRIRPGPLIECGQADLTLCAYMGADLRNQDRRVYRLLGCEITFFDGGLPRPGDTLKFQIEITGHATLAGVRMFFFQYDCTVDGRRIFSVRNGQAGFFTDEELAHGKGVMWDAASDAPPTADPAPFAAPQISDKRSFSADEVKAFRAGQALECFGEGFENCAAQSRPAHLPDDRLALFDEVVAFDPVGGPWGRGYLKARANMPADNWMYEGHFHEDPCMPGTLMAEAAVQALEFYAAALGLTIDRDGYVFEPMAEHTAQFVCRGQVVPDTDHEITYEVFVDEITDGDAPVIYASLLARSDGHKVFYCPRFGIRLRPAWPAPRESEAPLRVGPMQESRGDYAALLECANGPPSAAFGEMYAPFDAAGRVPRLPQPPYHMMTRVIDVSTRPNTQQTGATVSAEYDVPPKAWYFKNNRNGTMPFAVLSEIALQPCGWLASHCGFATSGGLKFRNLEGDGHVHAEVTPDAGTLHIQSTLSSFSQIGPMTIVSFELQVRFADGRPVLDLKTQFGFFPAEALARQAGLSMKPEHNKVLDLPATNPKLGKIKKRLAGGKLRMLDGVDLFDPEGGSAGLGLIRGYQMVDPGAWYFKAHFFQDPVQPGSLGLDALAQLLGRAVFLKGLDGGMTSPHLQTIATNAPIKWSYRGQVTPDKKRVDTVIEIVAIEEDGDGLLIAANGSLWRDQLRVYEVKPMCLRLVDLGA